MQDTMPAMRRFVILVVMAVVGCGGSGANQASAPASTESTEPAAAEPASLDVAFGKFHDVLDPRWQLPSGADRLHQMCDATVMDALVGARNELSGALRGRPNAGIESVGAALQIERSVDDLGASCQSGLAEFDAALTRVHDALMKAQNAFGFGAPAP